MAILGSSPAMNGPLWSTNLPMARALAATMPSGDAVVVELRTELAAIINVSNNEPMLPAGWDASIFDAVALLRPWPSHCIYVGHGPNGSGFNPSPWGSPYSSPSLAAGCPYDSRFMLYARTRADVIYWLRPLVGKCLVFHCGENSCHAADLVSLIN